MPNRNYQKGRRFEYRVLHYLVKKGWYVVRSYASKGLFDLVAVPPSTSEIRPWLIQCKVKDYIPPVERTALIQAQERYFGQVTIATKDKKGKLIFKRIQEYIK